MQLSDKFAVSDEVVAREVGGEMVLLDLASGQYFGLDTVGGRIWELLSERPRTLKEDAQRVESFGLIVLELHRALCLVAGCIAEDTVNRIGKLAKSQPHGRKRLLRKEFVRREDEGVCRPDGLGAFRDPLCCFRV